MTRPQREVHRRGDLGRDGLRAGRLRRRDLLTVASDDPVDRDGRAGDPVVRDARERDGHAERGDLVGADHRRRALHERVAVGAVHPERFGRLPDAAEVESLGHADEPGVDRSDRRLQRAVVGSGFARVVLRVPAGLGEVGAIAAVLEHAPVALRPGVDALGEPMPLVQPLGEREDLVRRPRLESARAAVGVIGVVVDARELRALLEHGRVLAVRLVLRHREHAPGAHLHARHHRPQIPSGVRLRHVVPDRRLRRVLQVEVERGVHVVPATTEVQHACFLVLAERRVGLQDVLHVVAEVRAPPGRLAAGARLGDRGLHGRCDRRIELRLRDLPLLQHAGEDVVASRQVLGVAVRHAVRLTLGAIELELHRIVDDRHERRRLRERDVGRGRRVVVVRRRLDPVHRAAEPRDVQVAEQDLTLAVALLDADRETHLLELAVDGGLGDLFVASALLLLVGGFAFALLHADVLHVLLGDRGAALGLAAGRRRDGGTHGALQVDAAVLIEPRILARHRGILHVLADLVPADLDPVLVVERGEQGDAAVGSRRVDVALLRQLADLEVPGKILEHPDRSGCRDPDGRDRRRDADDDEGGGGRARGDETHESTEDAQRRTGLREVSVPLVASLHGFTPTRASATHRDWFGRPDSRRQSQWNPSRRPL